MVQKRVRFVKRTNQKLRLKEGKDDSRENRLNLLNSVELPPSNTNYRSVLFNQAQVYIDAVARYYSYPILSVRNTWWPAFCRFYIENSVTKRWPYVFDGAHASCIGHEYIGHNIILRFLTDQMIKSQPGDDSTIQPYYNNTIRMFPQSLYRSVIQNWPLWGYRPANNSHITSFERITKPTNGWGFTFLDNGHHSVNDGHDCYGSRGANNSIATFKFQVPAKCQPCTIGISYLHSWNRSYIGDVHCLLHSVDSNHHHKLESNVTITGAVYNGVEMKATYPEETKFPSQAF
eukprot:gene6630-8958_t